MKMNAYYISPDTGDRVHGVILGWLSGAADESDRCVFTRGVDYPLEVKIITRMIFNDN